MGLQELYRILSDNGISVVWLYGSSFIEAIIREPIRYIVLLIISRNTTYKYPAKFLNSRFIKKIVGKESNPISMIIMTMDVTYAPIRKALSAKN
jgi:hypothetical protein